MLSLISELPQREEEVLPFSMDTTTPPQVVIALVLWVLVGLQARPPDLASTVGPVFRTKMLFLDMKYGGNGI